jgi:hypothetical protein
MNNNNLSRCYLILSLIPCAWLLGCPASDHTLGTIRDLNDADGVVSADAGSPDAPLGTGGAGGAGDASSTGRIVTDPVGGSMTGGAGASAGAGGAGGNTGSDPSPVTVTIEPGMTNYSSIMSSVPGLPLTPVVSGSVSANHRFRWRTDYGSFLLWSQLLDWKISDQGSDCTLGDTIVYWQYLSVPADVSIPVRIHLDLIEGATGNVLASDDLSLAWITPSGVITNPAPGTVSLYAAWYEPMAGTGSRQFNATWSNGTSQSIFIDSRCGADWQRFQDGEWVLGASVPNVCPNALPNLVELLPGATVHASNTFNLAAFGAGRYRLQGTYSVGCEPGGNCAYSRSTTSAEVRVLVLAGTSPGNTSTGSPGELHAECGDTRPCQSNQTAIEVNYDNAITCSCEILCDAAANACPLDTTCKVRAGLVSLCE